MDIHQNIFKVIDFVYANYPLIALGCFFPISIILAWEDFKYLSVNKMLGEIGAYLLIANVNYTKSILYFFISIIFLFAYKYFRKNSIQKIDIIFFSAGIIWMDIGTIPMYCLTTALILLVFKYLLGRDRIPFLTAWVFSFWIFAIKDISLCKLMHLSYSTEIIL